jgi:hypothetical protein
MATALMAGLATYGAAYGTTTTVVAIGLAAAATAATIIAEKAMAPNQPDQAQVTQLGDRATQIDKTALQKQAELPELDLGESDRAKRNRKKGKAALKIELDKAKAAPDTTGVQLPSAKDTGVQL